MVKEITTGIIAIIIVAAACVSLFFPVSEIGAKLIQSIATGIITYYFAVKTYPLASFIKK